MTAPSTGPLFSPAQLLVAELVSRLYATNPFDPAWIELHEAALGDDYVPGDEASLTLAGTPSANREILAERIGRTVAEAARHLAAGGAATPRELAIYQGLVLYTLWDDFGPDLQRIIDEDGVDASFYDDFAGRHRTLLAFPGLSAHEPRHLLWLDPGRLVRWLSGRK